MVYFTTSSCFSLWLKCYFGGIKQILAITFALAISTLTFAQEEEMINRRELGQTEIKFNMGTALFELIELSYERILNGDAGVGISTAYSFAESSEFRGMILPYFRFYPSERQKAEGFFLEANTGVIFSEEDVFESFPGNGQITSENRTGFGLGVAIGGKFISKRGLFGEVLGGLGREFNDKTSIEIYPRVGINFGFRF
ncbi:MAG: hypothetical protein ACJAQ4_002037 [Cryomorphaceae bacterium]